MPARILIVEDCKTQRELLLIIFKRFGYIVDSAIDGQDALDRLEKHHYDLVIMDARMPVLNGYDATRQLRQHENSALRSIPIIGLTACVLKHERERFFDAGINDFLSKPFNLKELEELVADRLNQPSHAKPHASLMA